MAKKVALFVDCDRLEIAFMTVIFDYLQNEGYKICVKKAYVTKDNLADWYNQLEKNYFKIVLGTNQANTNMKLGVDVAKSLYTSHYDCIAIASNYKEFGVLASEIRTKGIEALCFYQYSKGNESFLKRAYSITCNLEPNQEKKEQVIDFKSSDTDDMLDVFESALEGLDSKLLEATLSEAEASKSTELKTEVKTQKRKATKK